MSQYRVDFIIKNLILPKFRNLCCRRVLGNPHPKAYWWLPGWTHPAKEPVDIHGWSSPPKHGWQGRTLTSWRRAGSRAWPHRSCRHRPWGSPSYKTGLQFTRMRPWTGWRGRRHLGDKEVTMMTRLIIVPSQDMTEVQFYILHSFREAPDGKETIVEWTQGHDTVTISVSVTQSAPCARLSWPLFSWRIFAMAATRSLFPLSGLSLYTPPPCATCPDHSWDSACPIGARAHHSSRNVSSSLRSRRIRRRKKLAQSKIQIWMICMKFAFSFIARSGFSLHLILLAWYWPCWSPRCGGFWSCSSQRHSHFQRTASDHLITVSISSAPRARMTNPFLAIIWNINIISRRTWSESYDMDGHKFREWSGGWV